MPMRQPAVSDEAVNEFEQVIDALAPYGKWTQELYSALWLELLRRIAEAKLHNPLGVANDRPRDLHTIYEFDENGLKGFYSCTPNQFVLVSAEPSEQFFDFILGAKEALQHTRRPNSAAAWLPLHRWR